MSDVLREVVLIAATMTMGLMAGVFGIYGNAIMPGLRQTTQERCKRTLQMGST